MDAKQTRLLEKIDSKLDNFYIQLDKLTYIIELQKQRIEETEKELKTMRLLRDFSRN